MDVERLQVESPVWQVFAGCRGAFGPLGASSPASITVFCGNGAGVCPEAMTQVLACGQEAACMRRLRAGGQSM